MNGSIGATIFGHLAEESGQRCFFYVETVRFGGESRIGEVDVLSENLVDVARVGRDCIGEVLAHVLRDGTPVILDSRFPVGFHYLFEYSGLRRGVLRVASRGGVASGGDASRRSFQSCPETPVAVGVLDVAVVY